MARSSRQSARQLAQLAQEQGGYFTSKQALEAGYDYPHLLYHLSAGNFDRVEHGLYRLAVVPVSEHDELIRLSLWSRNRGDEPQAVVSHETALVLHGLSELLPGEVHLTVPRGFRKAAPPGCVLHRAKLGPEDVREGEGYRLTAPLRTLTDVAGSGVSSEQLGKAARDAIARGLITREALARAIRESRFGERLRTAVSG